MGFFQLSKHAQCVHSCIQVLVLDGHKDGKLNKWVSLKNISLSHSEIKEIKKEDRVLPPYFLKIRIRATQEFKLDQYGLISQILSLQTYYVPKVCRNANGTCKKKRKSNVFLSLVDILSDFLTKKSKVKRQIQSYLLPQKLWLFLFSLMYFVTCKIYLSSQSNNSVYQFHNQNRPFSEPGRQK